MNWIDKKYRDQLGNRQFDDRLRQKGKKDLEKLLAAEMPVTPTGSGRGPGFYAGAAGAVIILVSIAIGVWYWQQPDENQITAPQMIQQPIAKPAGGEMDLKRQQEQSGGPASPGLKNIPNTRPVITEDVTIASEPVSEKVPENTDDGLPMKPTRQDGVVQEFDPQINPDEGKPTAMGVPVKSDSIFEASGERAKFNSSIGTNSLMERDLGNTVAGEALANGELANPTPMPVSDDRKTTPPADPLITENRADAETDKSLVEEEAGNTEESDTLEQNLQDIAELQEEATPAENVISAARLTNLAFFGYKNPSEELDISNYKTFSPKRFALSLWGGYTFVGKRISGGSELYRDLRQEREEGVWTIPTGMSMDYFFNRNWTLTIGAGWAEYGEILNYEYKFTDSISGLDGRYNSPRDYGQVIQIDSTRIVDSIFVGHWNYDFTYVSQDSVLKNNNGSARWSYIEIPVMVGYRFGKGRIKPWIQTGISLGIPYGTPTSRYISPSGKGLQSQEEFRVSRAPLQYNYLLHLGTDYYLGSGWFLRLNLVGSYQLNPAYQSSGIEQRYYKIGGTFGIGYIF